VVIPPGSVYFTSHLSYSPEHLAGASVAWATDKGDCLCKRPLFLCLALKAANLLLMSWTALHPTAVSSAD
jgi:hypothetical protein